MKSNILKNILAVMAGLIFGSIVNMLLINLGSVLVTPPVGVDLTTPEGLKSGMPLMQPIHFLFPFLAHAIGTFVGAWVGARISVKAKWRVAMLIGMLFLAGGISMVMQLPSPLWFDFIDLILAYLPMAWFAIRLQPQK